MKTFQQYITELKVPKRFEKKKIKARKLATGKLRTEIEADLKTTKPPLLPGMEVPPRSTVEYSKQIDRLYKKEKGQRRAAEKPKISRRQKRIIKKTTPTQGKLDFAKRYRWPRKER